MKNTNEVMISGIGMLPVSDVNYMLRTSPPEKIGDDAIIAEMLYPINEYRVRLLPSGPFGDGEPYLVRIDKEIVYPFHADRQK